MRYPSFIANLPEERYSRLIQRALWSIVAVTLIAIFVFGWAPSNGFIVVVVSAFTVFALDVLRARALDARRRERSAAQVRPLSTPRA